MPSDECTDDTERGAIYPGTHWRVYCDPDGIRDGCEENWEIHPVEDLEEAGYDPCEMCYSEPDTPHEGGESDGE